MFSNVVLFESDLFKLSECIKIRKQDTQQNQMCISAYFLDVFLNYCFECHSDY